MNQQISFAFFYLLLSLKSSFWAADAVAPNPLKVASINPLGDQITRHGVLTIFFCLFLTACGMLYKERKKNNNLQKLLNHNRHIMLKEINTVPELISRCKQLIQRDKELYNELVEGKQKHSNLFKTRQKHLNDKNLTPLREKSLIDQMSQWSENHKQQDTKEQQLLNEFEQIKMEIKNRYNVTIGSTIQSLSDFTEKLKKYHTINYQYTGQNNLLSAYQTGFNQLIDRANEQHNRFIEPKMLLKDINQILGETTEQINLVGSQLIGQGGNE